MKILVIQLARLGDIYISWPTLRALKRTHPQAEIHLLTRMSFSEATNGLDGISKFWNLSPQDVLEPIIGKDKNLNLSLHRMESFISPIRDINFDWIINLTFSPFSSFLTQAISSEKSRVSGYTRDEFGYLKFPDQISCYFYSQVGLEKANRVHLADIFVALIGQVFVPEDWRPPLLVASKSKLPDNYITIHIGASQEAKNLRGFQWAKIARGLLRKLSTHHIVLVGGPKDRDVANEIISQIQDPEDKARVLDFVGKVPLREVFTILSTSDLLLGVDSVAIHIASIMDTPTYNISVGPVKFWETGPKATKSFVDRYPSVDGVSSEQIIDNICAINIQESPHQLIVRSDGLESYVAPQSKEEAFGWDLVRALYFGSSFPLADNFEFFEAALKVYDVCDVAIQTLKSEAAINPKTLSNIIDSTEEILKKISCLVLSMEPIISWFEGEKIKIPHGSRQEVVSQTIKVYENLKYVIVMYIPPEEIKSRAKQ